ncbi:3',5'-cyclic-nucleotide phosphodiesterase [Niastella yeongjuensis]|uniref:3',5'-cyclic-nucleotide phosphodiesterase n=1 Tax=Niastella yeongjuensis TaxID=354355 RepID=A0A1V9EF85_9BACT|nr:3',5'-cyclic-nucleotide phosphodiesterase [Niastella yeongjuensis]OQP44776.1 3',5'-cyclic-nucleotide phosphodiesterase [Niastella yeongjuensis]SEP42500.1 3',5'-cyclic-nucleotide phosphodiesterase [Niastella yeongjuensis]
MKPFLITLIVACVLIGNHSYSQTSFRVIPLGVKGGIDESNLSAYLIAPTGSDAYVCLDAGTLHYGIEKAIRAKLLTGTSAEVLKKNIKGYLISHAHLDHLSGMVINSPDDSTKTIYGLDYTIEVLKDKYFTWKSWANFANEGDKPALGKYHYDVLTPGTEAPLQNTEMQVTAFSLSHSNPYQSTAFLVRHKEAYVLYLGDTGADSVEHSDKMHQLWQQVAPLLKAKKLKALFIEVSFSNEQPDKQLFGHLTPHWLLSEMQDLASLSGTEALNNFQVVITHIKPGGNREQMIHAQLKAYNPLHLKLIFPEQAKLLIF